MLARATRDARHHIGGPGGALSLWRRQPLGAAIAVRPDRHHKFYPGMALIPKAGNVVGLGALCLRAICGTDNPIVRRCLWSPRGYHRCLAVGHRHNCAHDKSVFVSIATTAGAGAAHGPRHRRGPLLFPPLVVRCEQTIPVNVPDSRGLEAVTKDASDWVSPLDYHRPHKPPALRPPGGGPEGVRS